MEFRVLGPLQVVADGREIGIPAGRHRTLLATLLLRPNQVVSTDALVDRLWDGDPPRDARATAQTYVRRVRNLLGDQVIDTCPGGYTITISPDELDLTRFEDLLRRARTADRPAAEAALLAEALALWRGPALADVPSQALHRREVPALSERRLRALERRLALDLAAGRHADVVAELQAVVAEHPLRERFWGQLMTALAGSGRPAEALEAYQELRTRLAEELGTDPGPEVRDLHRGILQGTVPRPPVPATTAPGTGAPGQLPPDAAGFAGRTGALAELDRVLAGSAGTTTTVVAVTGPAGVGKTALAVRWAHRLRDRFDGGQLYVDLRGFADTPPVRPIEALARFLPALGVPAEQVPTELDAATAEYRSRLADRRVLVVLDNAADADQVRPLLPGGPGCLVMVTSRGRLGGLVARDGARPVVLDTLTPDECRALLADLLGAGRVAAEPAAAADLAELCGRLPLALRIAAANLVARPAYRLAGYVRLLAAGDRLAELEVAGDGSAGVRAAFGLSYRRLPGSARRMFRLLGLAPGPDLTAAAAAALAGTPPDRARQLLERLVGAHLLDQPVPGRFRCHDLLRLYAAERVRQEEGPADRDTARQRLYQHYLTTTSAAARLLYPDVRRLPDPDGPEQPGEPDKPGEPRFTDLAEARAWLDAERANLVAVVTAAAAHGPRPVAWRLTDALRGYLVRRALLVDWLAVAPAALASAEADGDPRALAAAHLSYSTFYWLQNRYPQAIGHARRALRPARESGWVDGEATVLGNLGLFAVASGRLAVADRHLTAALARYRRTGQLRGRAVVLNNLAMLYVQMGRLGEASQRVRQALAVSRETGSGDGDAFSRETLSRIHHLSGQLEPALEHATCANRHFAAVGYRGAEADTLRSIAAITADTGDLGPALDLARQALGKARDSGNRRVETECLNTLGAVQLRLERPAEAIDCHRQAAALAQDIDDLHASVEAGIGLADAHLARGERPAAQTVAAGALATAHRIGYRLLATRAAIILANSRQPA